MLFLNIMLKKCCQLFWEKQLTWDKSNNSWNKRKYKKLTRGINQQMKI